MGLFLRRHRRHKNGKDHTYWSLVENHRCSSGKVIQRQAIYLGELDQAQHQAWSALSSKFSPTSPNPTPELAFSPSTEDPSPAVPPPRIHFSEFSLHNPRQWGACWIADRLWRDLQLSEFWSQRLPPSREGTDWLQILQVLVTYRLIDPGSEFRLHREWFSQSAMADILGSDFSLAAKDNLYRCLDRLLPHREALFAHLQKRWKDLFAAQFEVVLYDLTSTYFESDPPFPEGDKRRYGYSRDHRSDCVQVVVALVITPEGFPLAYEVLPGNTQDRQTLIHFLRKIRRRFGKAQRTWIMDRGIPTEETLELMRKKRHRISYLVGTPKGRLSKLEDSLKEVPWKQAREKVTVKLVDQKEEVFVWVESADRVGKERSMRRRRLKVLIKRLKELKGQKNLERDALMIKLGQAKQQAGRTYGLMDIEVAEAGVALSYRINRKKLRIVRKREGRYLLRTNLTAEDPAKLWEMYLRLVEVESAFKNLKGDLAIRPIYHSKENRVEAHLFVAFMAYSLHVCLRGQLKRVAGGLTPRTMLEKFGRIELIDVHLPVEGGKTMVMTRRTQPDVDQRMLLERLGWELPEQGPPRISASGHIES
jgi:transposase